MRPDPATPAHAVYRPEPEAPSPRWARASRRLDLVVRFTWLKLCVDVAGGALSWWGRSRLMLGHTEQAAAVFPVVSALHLVAHLAACAVWIAAFTALVALPAWVGARPLARACRALAVAQVFAPFVSTALTVAWSRSAMSTSDHAARGLLFAGADAVVSAAYVLLVAAMLQRVATTLDPARPTRLMRWATLSAALSFGALGSGLATVLFGLGGAAIAAVPFALGVALSTLQVWGWTRGLRTVSEVLGAQPWPESHRGGPDAVATGA